MEENVFSQQEKDIKEADFLTYITSLVFQTMVFLGEVPNPVSNQIEKNLKQAKLLIDTLLLIRQKTKGNLTTKEENLINSAIYEFQVKYVDLLRSEEKS